MAKRAILNQPLNALLEDYRRALVEAGIPVERLILFGSRAKGYAKEWSDIDLCVVSKAFGRDPFAEMVKLKKIAARIEPLIEPHAFHPNDLNPLDPLASEVLTHGKTVYQE